jgi:hypothetical protein
VRSKNAARITPEESAHLAAVKSVGCVVCDASPPNEAHHIEQGCHYTTVAVCDDCHRGSFNGWHGQKRMWRIKKWNEIDALNETIRRVKEMSGDRIAA